MDITQLPSELAELAELAQLAAKASAEAIMPHFRSALNVDRKSDGSPVTIADKNAEQCIVELIRKRRPKDGWVGEEFGSGESSNGYKWIIDPIDGTIAFVHGVPLFGTLIACEKDGQVLLGLINLPATEEMVIGIKGHGSYYNGQRCHVSSNADLAQATIMTSNFNNLLTHNRLDGFTRLLRRTREGRTWGDCYGYMLVATGRADIMVDPILAPWDVAPMLPIITEAGGCVTSLDGQKDLPFTSLLATNGLLHEKALACFTC